MKITRYHHRHQAPAPEDIADGDVLRELRINRRLRRWGVRDRWRWGFGPTIRDAIRDMESQRTGAEAIADALASIIHEGQEAGRIAGNGIESMGTELRITF